MKKYYIYLNGKGAHGTLMISGYEGNIQLLLEDEQKDFYEVDFWQYWMYRLFRELPSYLKPLDV